ncbi:Oxo-4-hydroxy-4-carboxy-5-ureidoimidazoline decarboxylase [Boeremia exigua]|uniref:Oxo-4-hydroxy-4-carboxy-5-ureidoimidazoline decarboxylase n=1 Tax=Boeremia exigua TaxID=749465 RepID=UPI001E8D6046|nr:Oxo-4-hydroxy-4-carboxy-5-ureidoimidazoline decarboxylase [Boeremia exigua]KAH6642182.1 Oxo-4-hydroxy-4-carboxy-5-ureidoimidazoline decarboxylase [Boeremia exigua]
MTSLPAISTLPHAADSELTTVLDLLFEPSPPLNALTLPVLRSTTFPSYDVLITAVNAQLKALASSDSPEDVKKLSEILCSHPRLGEKKVESEQSRKEQAQLQQGAEEEKEKLASLNREYEEKFPGLRYVVFVNGRPRPVVMENMRSRIDRGDIKAERQEAIQAMCDIALDRATKLQA